MNRAQFMVHVQHQQEDTDYSVARRSRRAADRAARLNDIAERAPYLEVQRESLRRIENRLELAKFTRQEAALERLGIEGI